MGMNGRRNRASRGFALVAVLFTILVSGIFVQSMLSTGQAAMKSARAWRNQDYCLLAAHSTLEKVANDIAGRFTTYFNASTSISATNRFAWFNTASATSIGASSPATLPSAGSPDTTYGRGTSVTVTWLKTDTLNVNGSPTLRRRLTLKSSATCGSSQRNIVATVDFGMSPSLVFNYIVCLNNSTSASATGNINGDMWSNGSMTLGPTSLAGTISASGTIGGNTPTAVSLSTYITQDNHSARPTNPPNTTKAIPDVWPMGYTGVAKTYPGSPTLPMPFMGDMSFYEDQAVAHGGTITYYDPIKAANVTINGVYGDNATTDTGPSGLPKITTGTVMSGDYGMIVMMGTTANPIVINGPVVIRNDVIITGVVSGQGVIYSGRNIHVVGDLTYKNPPTWSRQDSNPTATATANAAKDLICLSAKGNIVLGNYKDTGWTGAVTTSALTTSTYNVDPTDKALGYCTGGTTAVPTFNGAYANNDGGTKVVKSGTGTALTTSTRKFYECSNEVALASTALAAAASVVKIDGVMFTNHNVIGWTGGASTGQPFIINGSRVSRDKSLLARGGNGYQYNWDIRLGSYSRDSMGLLDELLFPVALGLPTISYWREGGGG